MTIADLGDVQLHYRLDGPEDGAPLLLVNSLGTDLRLWDDLLPLLPDGLRIIRYDKRGHGRSSLPDAPCTMGALVKDAEALLDHLGQRDAVVVGLSIGGMIAQGLAVKRLDLVRGLVLSNTAAKIGTRQIWQDRARVVETRGLEPLADGILARWLPPRAQAGPQAARCREMLIAQPARGYAACCLAIAGTDFYTPTASLRLPLLGIAGSEDRATPPDLVRETVDLVPGARFCLMRGAGHLPPVDAPADYATILGDFLREIGHI